MRTYTDPAPVYDKIIDDEKDLTYKWQSWINSLRDNIDAHNYLVNEHVVLNPDFNWSRTKGSTPTVADGEFVEEWNVKANGMTFSITPTFYTSTTNGSNSGSERYVNVDITVINTNEFILYQSVPKMLSAFESKTMTFSSSIYNNGAAFNVKFYVGFDMTGGGTDSYSAESRNIRIDSGYNEINAQFRTPAVATDNQTNVITLAMKLVNLTNVVDADVFFIKPEFSREPTPLYVNHTIEKLKIDNA